MAWDIYGQSLRPGYCEVHPDVPEEYPCRLCQIDHDRDREDRRLEMERQLAYQKEYEEHCRMEAEQLYLLTNLRFRALTKARDIISKILHWVTVQREKQFKQLSKTQNYGKNKIQG